MKKLRAAWVKIPSAVRDVLKIVLFVLVNYVFLLGIALLFVRMGVSILHPLAAAAVPDILALLLLTAARKRRG